MAERRLEAACADCGRPLSFHPLQAEEGRPVRCETCFDQYLRDIDHDFLASYAELGVTSRRTVAETCLRALVLEAPPARKVLAMTILEQFLLASADLIGLCAALRERERLPIVRSFLSFRLDGEASGAFFGGLPEAAGGGALGGGLRADQVASLVLDERRRQLVVRALPVDERKLAEVVDAIDCLTRAS